MSSALSVTCRFYVFDFILTIGHIGPAHCALSWCMSYLTDRGMCNLDNSIVHHLYWSTQFLFSSFYDLHIWLSQFYLAHNVNTSLRCLLLILSYFAHLPKLYYAFYHHMLCLISGSFCLVLILFDYLINYTKEGRCNNSTSHPSATGHDVACS